jgi:hypothetical protein
MAERMGMMPKLSVFPSAVEADVVFAIMPYWNN